MSEHQLKASVPTNVRPPVAPKEEDPRDRAARRTAEIIDHLESSGLDDHNDRFYIPQDVIPDGWVYEWKRFSTLNLEDPHYLSGLQRLGWDFVPADRHPDMMPQGSKGHILRDGQVLMERPEQIQKIARDRETKRARDQVRVKEQQLTNPPKEGPFERDNKGQPLVKVRKDWSPMQIPD